MKTATVFFSTAALMAGTACGVYAETGDSATSSFDRATIQETRSQHVEYAARDYPLPHPHME